MNVAKLDTLATVVNDFNASWQYCQGSWHQRWSDSYALYNNNRVKRGYEGITDTFVPMTFSTIETMVSALFGTKPKFNYLPPHTKPDQNTDILNALVDHYWDKDQWGIKVINWGRSMLMLGTSVVYIYWENDHPCMINVPIRDFFIDPTASTLSDARYMGRRFLTTKAELESFEIIDLERLDELGEPTGEMKKKYQKLDQIKGKATEGEQTDKQRKDMFYGSTVDDKSSEQIEVLEYWTKDKVISVANRSVIIENSDNPYKLKAQANGNEYADGLMPFAALRDYVDESLFYAKGEVDFIGDEQELLNDITNQNIDSVTFTLNQMYTLDPIHADLLESIENIPGAVYLAKPGTLVPIQQRPIPPDAFQERQNLKNEIRETTASNEVVKGVSQDSQATATEINAQIAGAGQRINLKVTQIENEGFHTLGKIVFTMIQLYVNEATMVRIVGRDGIRWEEFDPLEFKGQYEPRVQLDISIENQQKEDAAMAKDMLAAFLNDPEINQQELKKLVMTRAFKLDPDEVDSLMMPAPPMGMPGIDPATGMPMDPGMGAPMEPPLMAGMQL